MMAVAGGIALAAGVLLFVLEPLLSGRGAPAYGGDDRHDEAAARRRVALAALRDLEYDRATGKLDAEDYAALESDLSREALDALGAAAADMPEDPAAAALEREIAAVRQALREGLQCGSCRHVNASGARFCSRCGDPLGAAS